MNTFDLYHIKTKEKIGTMETPFSFKGESVSQAGFITPGKDGYLLKVIQEEQKRVFSGVFDGKNSMFAFAYIKIGNLFKPIQLNRFGRMTPMNEPVKYMSTINTLFDNLDYYTFSQRGY